MRVIPRFPEACLAGIIVMISIVGLVSAAAVPAVPVRQITTVPIRTVATPTPTTVPASTPAPPAATTYVTCEEPCKCMTYPEAVSEWGEGRFVRCDERPCREAVSVTGERVALHCYRGETPQAAAAPPAPARQPGPLVTVAGPVAPSPTLAKPYTSAMGSPATLSPFNPQQEPGVFKPANLSAICVDDADCDGVPDGMDNCPYSPNLDQKDSDSYLLKGSCKGTVCKIPDTSNCEGPPDSPLYKSCVQAAWKKANPDGCSEQPDCTFATDGYGDACDTCREILNADQADQDKDCDILKQNPAYWDGSRWIQDPRCGDSCAGPLILKSVQPVQVHYDTPLVMGKGTAFRIRLDSKYTTDQQVMFRLTLPDDEWGLSNSKPGDASGITYSSQLEGPVTIPALANDVEIMLPYVALGHENDTAFAGTVKDVGKIYPGTLVSSLLGTITSQTYVLPDYRIMPAPVKSGTVHYMVEVDPANQIGPHNGGTYTMQGTAQAVKTKGWNFLLINIKSNDIVYDPAMTDDGMKIAFEHLIAAFPIPDQQLTAVIAPTTGYGPCFSGICKDAKNNDIPCPGTGSCGYGYDLDAKRAALKAEGVDQRYWDLYGFEDWAATAKSWGYDVPVGMGMWFGSTNGVAIGIDPYAGFPASSQQPDPLTGQDRPWGLSHEFLHWTAGNPDDGYWQDCTLAAEPGFWVNNYRPAANRLYFIGFDMNSDSNWIIRQSMQGLNANNPTCLANHQASKGSNPPPANDGYLNLAQSSVFAGTDPEALLVRGMFFKNGTAEFGSFSYLPQATLDLLPGSSGDYTFVLSDAEGNVLNRTGYTPWFYMSKPLFPGSGITGGPTDAAAFVERIAWVPGTARIGLQDKENRELASRTVSAHAPVVTLRSPNGREFWTQGESQTIRWNARDADGDILTYTVGISGDGGMTWLPLGLDIYATEYTLRSGDLTGGDRYRVKVIASDGVNTGEAISVADFSVSRPPAGPSGLPIVLLGIATAGVIVLVLVWYVRKRYRSTSK